MKGCPCREGVNWLLQPPVGPATTNHAGDNNDNAAQCLQWRLQRIKTSKASKAGRYYGRYVAGCRKIDALCKIDEGPCDVMCTQASTIMLLLLWFPK